MKVLIADDSEVFVERLLRALGEINGIEIVGRARTGAEAVQALRQMRPEIVILDISMPDGSGIDVLESMRRENLSPITIVLTALAFSQYRRRCLQLGARFFFDKSTEFTRVSEVLSRLAQEVSASGENRSGGMKREAH